MNFDDFDGEIYLEFDQVVEKQRTEHRFRVVDPKKFESDSFRRKRIDVGIFIIIARLKGKTTTTTQAYRFKIDKFTFSQAKKWMKSHSINFIDSEEAKTVDEKPEDLDKTKNKAELTEKNLNTFMVEQLDRIIPMVGLLTEASEGLASVLRELREEVVTRSLEIQPPTDPNIGENR